MKERRRFSCEGCHHQKMIRDTGRSHTPPQTFHTVDRKQKNTQNSGRRRKNINQKTRIIFYHLAAGLPAPPLFNPYLRANLARRPSSEATADASPVQRGWTVGSWVCVLGKERGGVVRDCEAVGKKIKRSTAADSSHVHTRAVVRSQAGQAGAPPPSPSPHAPRSASPARARAPRSAR